MMSDDEIIAVVQAHKDGKTIEAKSKVYKKDEWHKVNPHWNFSGFDYRVKPEPRKPREWWFHELDDGSVVPPQVWQRPKRSILLREVLDE